MKVAVKQIEDDEWKHRENILGLMERYEVPVLRSYEIRYYVIGKIISASCYVIGRFMPFFFAGKLESGNVCEYFVMMRHFHSLGIREHDAMLYEMGMKEKEHEVYFLERIETSGLLPLFQRLFHGVPGPRRMMWIWRASNRWRTRISIAALTRFGAKSVRGESRDRSL